MTVINSLWHFTEEKFIFNRNHIYGSDKHELKPSGLWLSNENGKNPWSEFCFNNSEPELLNYMTEFKIKDDSNILIINSYDDAIKLNEEYAYTRKNDFFGEKMRWDKIKKKYHGILIPDYIKPEIPDR